MSPPGSCTGQRTFARVERVRVARLGVAGFVGNHESGVVTSVAASVPPLGEAGVRIAAALAQR
jgi:hypothetical protein